MHIDLQNRGLAKESRMPDICSVWLYVFQLVSTIPRWWKLVGKCC